MSKDFYELHDEEYNELMELLSHINEIEAIDELVSNN